MCPEWTCSINNGELKKEKRSFPLCQCLKGNCSELCEGNQNSRGISYREGVELRNDNTLSRNNVTIELEKTRTKVCLSLSAYLWQQWHYLPCLFRFLRWETRQTSTIFGQSGLSWRCMIEGNKFKLRYGKSSSDTRETNKIEGGQALEGGAGRRDSGISILGDAKNLTERH